MKTTKLFITLTLLAIVASIVVFTNLGKNLELPTNFSLKIDAPDYACTDSKEDTPTENSKQVVIDQQGSRLIVVDEKKEVKSIIEFSTTNKYLNKAEYATLYGDSIYIAGFMYNSNGINFTEQRIVKYGVDGSFQEVIYSEITNMDRYATFWLYDVQIYNNEIYTVGYNYKTISIDKLIKSNELKSNELSPTYTKENIRSFEPKELITAASYQPKEDSCILVNLIGNYILNYRDTQIPYTHEDFIKYLKSLDKEDSNLLYEIDKNHNNEFCLKLTDLLSSKQYIIETNEINSFDINYNNSSFSICNTDKNEVIAYDYNVDKLNVYSKVNYNFLTIINIIAIWLSLLYLIVLAIVLIIRTFIRYHKEEIKKFYRIIIGTLIFISAICTALYFCNGMYEKEKNDIYNLVQMESQYYSETSNEIGHLIQDEDWTNKLRSNSHYDETIAKMAKIRHRLDTLCHLSAKYDSDLFYRILYYNKTNNTFNALCDSRNIITVGGYDKQFDNLDKEQILNNQMVVGEDKDSRDKFIYAYSPIHNDKNEVVGCIQIGSYIQSLDTQMGNIAFRLIVLLILLLIIIYLLTVEIRQTRKGLNRFRYYKKNGLFFPEINLIGTIDYLKNMFFNADCVLCILITKEMLVQYGLENDGVLLGMPTVLAGVGILVGPFIFSFFKKLLTIRKIYIIASCLVIGSMVVAVFNVINNQFFIFCAMKLIEGIGFSIIDVGDNTYPLFLTNKKFREGIIKRLSLTDIATSVLSVSIAGQLANMFGTFSIYIFIAALGGILLILCIYILPRNKHFKAEGDVKPKKTSKKTLLKLCFTPGILMSILFTFAVFLINGYKSTLFPLYVDGMNYSQTDISNMFAICATIAFVFNQSYKEFTDRFDIWAAAIINLVFVSAIYCIFGLNTSVMWALVAVVAIYLIHRSLISQKQTIWPRQCVKLGVEPSVMQPFFSVIEGIASILRPLILGVFINIGGSNACFILGVCLAIFTVVYFVVTRKTALSESTSNW